MEYQCMASAILLIPLTVLFTERIVEIRLKSEDG